ncbi:MAG: phytanoyl-CoA dioxygenase family protein [Planctomycetota bacterium]|nr:phytanoyl-CoA dioxygenase family protein [Planctomycetota bacterium]
MSLHRAERQRLDEDGFVVLHSFAAGDLLRALRERLEELYAAEGERAGSEFKQEPGCRRLAGLVGKGDVFQRALLVPELLDGVRHILGPRFKLSSLNARSVNPRSDVRQPLHADMGAVADDGGYWVANVVWMLDDFTARSGALRAVPGSHRWRKLPEESLEDPRAPHRDEVLITGEAGSVALLNAHVWHGGLGNATEGPRRALHAFFCRRDKPQQQYQKALLGPEAQAGLAPELRDLLALDDPLNDELSAEFSRRSGFLE